MAEKLSGKIKDFLFGGLREDDFEDDEFYGFFTDWDNTPRYREKSIIFVQ